MLVQEGDATFLRYFAKLFKIFCMMSLSQLQRKHIIACGQCIHQASWYLYVYVHIGLKQQIVITVSASAQCIWILSVSEHWIRHATIYTGVAWELLWHTVHSVIRPELQSKKNTWRSIFLHAASLLSYNIFLRRVPWAYETNRVIQPAMALLLELEYEGHIPIDTW